MSVDPRAPRITTSFQEALSDGYVELVMPPYVFQDHTHLGQQAHLDQSMLHHDNPFYPPGVMNNRTYQSAVNVIPAENLNLYHPVPLPCVAYDVASVRRPSTTSTASSISTDFDTPSTCGNANMKSIPFNQPMMTPANTPIASPLIDGPSDARAFPYPRTSDSTTTTTPPLRSIKVKLADIGKNTSASFGVDTGIKHCDAPPLGMDGSGDDSAGGESVKKPQHPCEICGKTFTRAYNLRETLLLNRNRIANSLFNINSKCSSVSALPLRAMSNRSTSHREYIEIAKENEISPNAGGQERATAESGGTKSKSSDSDAVRQAHENTTAEKHWGTTQKYRTEEEAYRDQYSRGGGRGDPSEKDTPGEPDPTVHSTG
ncbi:hypothetical protein HDU85_002542 [Gaertneriomyces sp. JEL0708]|nr:hypothetical protein HDU85_002542 [Gaertneriomyces sp. JEL0708]